ncbi:hypothetical protein P8452_28142 [Trifolium repens]|nr:hypothetical protein P8452_28142 [Trifolium repens]
MENRRIQQSREHERERRTQYQRNSRQRMSNEQRQQELLRRREDYNQSKEKGKQVETSTNNIASRVSFQNITNISFTSTRIQGTHDFEAGSSVRHINDSAFG